MIPVDATGVADWLRAAYPDVILLDWELPGLPPTALLPLLHYYCPGLKMVALSSQPQARRAALAAGADGKLSPVEREIIASMAAVMDCPVALDKPGQL